MTLDPRLFDRLSTETPARRWVLDTLTQASERPKHASAALRAASRDSRKLRSRERRALWDVVYELIRHQQALAHRGEPSWAALLDSWLADPLIPAELPDAVRLGCIEAVAADLRSTWGEQLDSWLEASNTRAPTFLRANLARIRPAELAKRLAQADIHTQPAGEQGLQVVGRANLLGHPAWRQGLFEVQDLGSQRVAARVDPADKQVLDLCAGAGGKSLALAALGGRVTAADIRSRALGELRSRAKRARCQIETVLLDSPDALGSRRFDRVLVDAPCTGTGVWRRHPEFRWRVDDAELTRLSALQAELLVRGAAHTRPDGVLVYATCSALHRENEAIVDGFLDQHPEWERHTPDLRTAPHLDGTDGMFAASLARRG